MKKFLSIILIIALIASISCMFFACDKKETLKLEYDKDSTFGLFFYGEDCFIGNNDIIRASKDMDETYFDPKKPTIIWVHGWESSYSDDDYDLTIHKDTLSNLKVRDDCHVIYLKEAGYNVATFQYQNKDKDFNFAADLAKIFSEAYFNINNTGKSMAYYFASELCEILGDNYNQDIIYVGHSCGSFVTLAINNMVAYFLENNIISNKHLLASQMLLADPYTEDMGTTVKTYEGEKIYGTNEAMGKRTKAMLCQDIIKRLYEKHDVITQVYLGMKMASGNFQDATKYSIVVDMGGFKNAGIEAANGLHCITRDWVITSIYAGKLKDSDDNLAPSGAISADEAKQFIGKKYTQTLAKLNVKNDVVNFVESAK